MRRLVALQRAAPWLPWVVCGTAIALSTTGLLLLALSWTAPVPESWGFRGFTTFFAFSFSTVGALVVSRRPENAIGWILLLSGLLAGVQGFIEEYAIYAILERHGELPGGALAGWINSWIWVQAIGYLVTFTFLLFPDGKLHSARWRPVAVMAAAAPALVSISFAFLPGPLNNSPFVTNPLPSDNADLITTVGSLGFLTLFLSTIGSGYSLSLRFRSARGVEREQLKWLAYTGALVPVAMIVGSLAPSPSGLKLPQLFLIASISLMPVAIGVAILRYRLYDIDLLINRTLVYGAVTVTLGATYVLAVIVLQRILAPVTTGNDLAIAASTLVIAALFQPVRRRIQEAVDRRFYRRKYDAAKTIDAFSGRLRQEIDLDTLSAELLAVVGETMQPASATLWLRRRGPA